MKPIERGEVLGLGAYEGIRDAFRARVIAEKKLRRVHVGDRVTLVFENRDTVLLQIQEMLRTERITKESSITHEIATYNELVPGPNELSATLMIEIDDADERNAFLARAVGFERAVSVVVDGDAAPARWSAERELSDRASAVQYLRFALSEKAAKALAGGQARVSVRVSHDVYAKEAELPVATVKSLAEDLAEG